jgi:hypothetical protein
MQTQEEVIQTLFPHICKILKVEGLHFRPMRRIREINTKKSYVVGRINLKTKTITLDLYTAKKREPKKIASILRVLAHEIAHIQKPPYYQRYRGRLIVRQHYPRFYKQVNRNIADIKKDEMTKGFMQNR